MTTRPTPLAVSFLIPANWTPEQALAVLELLDDLRDALWAIHGDWIQEHLQQQQASAGSITPRSDLDSDDPAF